MRLKAELERAMENRYVLHALDDQCMCLVEKARFFEELLLSGNNMKKIFLKRLRLFEKVRKYRLSIYDLKLLLIIFRFQSRLLAQAKKKD